jgi:hypothetical protein
MFTNQIKIILGIGLFIGSFCVNAQSIFPNHQININGFRNPSIGGEYQYKQVSVHAGYYTTAFNSGEYTNFIRTGITYWFLPIENRENPSSFYSSVSYALGFNRDYKDKSAAIGEIGFRWFVWQGLNLRLGVAGLASKGKTLKINPTPGISYSLIF